MVAAALFGLLLRALSLHLSTDLGHRQLRPQISAINPEEPTILQGDRPSYHRRLRRKGDRFLSTTPAWNRALKALGWMV